MNRTDRLLAILLELQARRYTRAEDLAGRFEVSVRTVYRDVFAMCESGVPVISTPGYGYSLAPGYFLPPLMLTPDEAGTLLLGAAFVSEQVDAPYREATEVARKKIEKLLPEQTRREVDFLLDSLRFLNPRPSSDPGVTQRMTLIRRAIAERDVLRIEYQARHGEPGTRDIEPHGLVCIQGRWVLAAYCRSRKEMRSFRLDRMDALIPLGLTFERRSNFTVRTLPAPMRGGQEVHALFTADAARWALEDPHFSFQRVEQQDGGTVLVFAPRQTHELVPWLLSWCSQVRVLSPESVRTEVLSAAKSVVALYSAG